MLDKLPLIEHLGLLREAGSVDFLEAVAERMTASQGPPRWLRSGRDPQALRDEAREFDAALKQLEADATARARGTDLLEARRKQVTKLPAGAEVLASSNVSPVQVMSIGRDILATQFHGELTPALIERWAHLPQYIEWLNAAMGPNAYERVRAQSKPQMPKVERLSRTMFENLVSNRRSLRAAA